MEFTDFTAGKDDNDRRIDKIVRLFAKNLALSEIYKLIRKGLIKLNNKKCTPDIHVHAGDIISIASFLLNSIPAEEDRTTGNSDFDIVFQNLHLLIINKPYNVNVHGESNSLDLQVKNFYKKNVTNTSISFNPGPLHRLDKKTTGLIAFSLSLEGARWFSKNIQNHNIQKTYYAILQGHLEKQQEWTDIITNDRQKSNGYYIVKASEETLKDNSRKSISTVTPLAYGVYKNIDVTFTQINIHTGRKHQIRAQSSLHNHPLLGDETYGGKKLPDDLQSFYLHAGKLVFPENSIGLPKSITTSLPEKFTQMLKYCGIEKMEL